MSGLTRTGSTPLSREAWVANAPFLQVLTPRKPCRIDIEHHWWLALHEWIPCCDRLRAWRDGRASWREVNRTIGDGGKSDVFGLDGLISFAAWQHIRMMCKEVAAGTMAYMIWS